MIQKLEQYFSVIFKIDYRFIKMTEPDFYEYFIFRDITNNIIHHKGFNLTENYDKILLDIFRKSL